MKKSLIIGLLLLTPYLTFAAPFSVTQGGTGTNFFPQGGFLFGNGTNPIKASSSPTVGYITATSSNATSIFNGNVSVGGQFQFGPGTGLLSALNGLITLINTAVDGRIDIKTGENTTNANVPDFAGTIKILSEGNISSQNGDAGNISIAGGPGGITSGKGGTVWIQAGTGSGGALSGNDGNVIVTAADGNWGIGLIGGQNNGFVPDGPNTFVLYTPPSNILSVANYDGNEAKLDTSLISSPHKIFSFPNFSGTFALLENNQTWTGLNQFNKGASATTTVNFGGIGDSSSHSCFNTKNTIGDDISLYFIGTTMVVENNLCK